MILTVVTFHLDHRFALPSVFLVSGVLVRFELARLIFVSFEVPAQEFVRRRTRQR